MGHPMRIELTRVGLLVYLANHYTTRGAQITLHQCGFQITLLVQQWRTYKHTNHLIITDQNRKYKTLQKYRLNLVSKYILD